MEETGWVVGGGYREARGPGCSPKRRPSRMGICGQVWSENKVSTEGSRPEVQRSCSSKHCGSHKNEPTQAV